MTVLLSPNAKQQFFTSGSVAAAGYLLYTYAANSTTPQATYTNRAGSVANTNPIVLDARGEATIYLTPGVVYDYVLKTDQDVTVWTREDVSAAAGDATAVMFTASSTGAVERWVSEKLSERLSIKDFGAVGDGVTDDSTAFSKLVTYVNSRSSNRGTVVYIPDGTYLVTVAPGTFNRPCSIIGEGAATCVFHFQDCDGLKWDLSTQGGINAFNFTNTVRGVGFLTSGTTRTGLYFKGRQTFGPHLPVLTLEALEFNSYTYYTSHASNGYEWLYAIDLSDVDEVYIANCHIKGGNTDGNYSGATGCYGIRLTTGTGLRVHHSQFNCLGYGISLNGQSEGLIASGLTMVAVTYGIKQDTATAPSNNHCITNSHFSVHKRAVSFDSANSTLAHVIMGNYIIGGGTDSGDYIGIDLGASTRCQVAHNTLSPTSAGIASDVGINVGGGVGGGYNFIAYNFFRHQATCIKINAASTVVNIVSHNYKEVDANTLLTDLSGLAVGTNVEGTKKSVNYGTATILTGTTSITVSHGLSGTPDVISLTPKGSVSSGKQLWVTNDGATTFQIACSAAPASDWPIYWVARKNAKL